MTKIANSVKRLELRRLVPSREESTVESTAKKQVSLTLATDSRLRTPGQPHWLDEGEGNTATHMMMLTITR